MEKNKGFSLVELLVTIAILSIVLITVTSIMVTGSKQFTKGNADANMQGQAQLVVNQIEDMIIDTNGGVNYVDNTSERELVLYNVTDVSGVAAYSKEVIKWTGADKKLSYSKWNVVYDVAADAYIEDSAIYTDQLLAEDVSDFKVDLSDIKQEYDKDGNEIDIVQSVQISAGYIGNGGQVSYATSPIITLRNRMMLSDSPTLIFNNTPSVDDTLALYISSVGAPTRVPIQDMATTVERTGVYNIYAMVNAANDVNSLVNWTIEEEGTLSTIDSNGMLQIGEFEPNQYLTIVATYKNNPGKKAKGVVTVPSARTIDSVQVVPVGLPPFSPNFDSIVELADFSEAEKNALVYKWTVSEPTWVNDFTDSGPKLELPVKRDPANFGKTITITLTVSAPTLGCVPKTDSVTYTIPLDGDTGNSYVERGNSPIEYNYAKITNDDVLTGYTIYFCDEFGNRRSDLDDYLSEIEITSSWVGGYILKVSDNLPADVSYYLKVIMHWTSGTSSFDNVRIFYIPAVILSGQDTQTQWNSMTDTYSGINYKLYGHYSDAEAWNTGKYKIDVQEVVSNAPDGVEITATISDSYTLDAQNHLMGSDVYFTVSGDTAGKDLSQLKVHSVKVKISMVGTDIFTYSTLTFTD